MQFKIFAKNFLAGMYPLATCYCDSENEDNWAYFYTHLKGILQTQNRLITFVSDRGLGLLSAFDKIFPGNPHLYCYKHLTFNLRSTFRGKLISDTGEKVTLNEVQEAFFKVAYSSTVLEYDDNVSALRVLGGTARVNKFLESIPLQHWCRAFSPPNRSGNIFYYKHF
jgi:hypothetical protein